MNMFEKSAVLLLAAFCVTNLVARDIIEQEDVVETRVIAPRVSQGRKNAKRILQEIGRAQKRTRKAMKRYLSSASSYGMGTATKRSQRAVDEAAAQYCDVLHEITEYVENGSLKLSSFMSIHGIEIVALKNASPSKLWPVLTGSGIGFVAGAASGAALAYFGIPMVVPFGIESIPAWAVYGLTFGVAGAVLGGLCGLAGACLGHSSIDEEALEEAEEYLEVVIEKINRAETTLAASL